MTWNSDQRYVVAWMRGEFGEEWIHIYMYGWVPLLFTWNYYNIVNQLYSNIRYKNFFNSFDKLVFLKLFFFNNHKYEPEKIEIDMIQVRNSLMPPPQLIFVFKMWHSVLDQFSSVESLSRVQLCDPMNRSTPGLPVDHQLPEFTQTHVHWVRDAIQPSHPWLSPSPPAPSPSQHQTLFQWVNSSHEVAKVLELQL